MKAFLQSLIRKTGWAVVRYPPAERIPLDVSERDRRIIERVRPFTLTSLERIVALVEAVRYVVRRDVPEWKSMDLSSVVPFD